ELRLRKWLALAKLCRQARFDKVTGKRLEEFLGIVMAALDDEIPADPFSVAAPSWVGRVFFRPLFALYIRKDSTRYRGRASRNRLTLLGAALGFARGTGPVPSVNTLLPDATFEEIEAPLGPLPPECEDILERYYSMKIHSLQFTGATN